MSDPKAESGTEEEKEQHRLGTIGRWDPPEADWAAEHDWTRYRGPGAYPVPGNWVLNLVEADGIIWHRYPGIGEGQATDDDVWDTIVGDDAYNEARAERAMLGHDVVNEQAPMEDWLLEQKLSIGGTTIFKRVEPDPDELNKHVAKALAAVDEGHSPEDIEVPWESGRDRGGVTEHDEADADLGDFS